MAESCSNDGGDDDDAAGGEGKRKVDCEGEADDDDGDNDNGGVDDDGGVDINDGNDANGGDSMSKSDCDDVADGGGGNSNDDGSADGDGIFENWCFDSPSTHQCGDEADDDEQTENIAGDLTECNESSKMEMTVGIMRWGILKETQQHVHKKLPFLVSTMIWKVYKACSSTRYYWLLHNGWINIHWMLSRSN